MAMKINRLNALTVNNLDMYVGQYVISGGPCYLSEHGPFLLAI